MINLNVNRGPFKISTDQSLLEMEVIYHWLKNESYWATNRSMETIQRSIENSLCFGLFYGARQVGFARVVTDYATFAWLCDVFVLSEYRGRGLGKWLIETISSQPIFNSIRLFILATKDAHGLYERYGGFESLKEPTHWMTRPIK